MEQYSFGGRNRSLKCALCRQATHHSDISYVSTKKSAEEEEEDTIVIVSVIHSTSLLLLQVNSDIGKYGTKL